MIYKRLVAGWAAVMLALSFFTFAPPTHADTQALYEISTPAYLTASPTSSTARAIAENATLKSYLREQLMQFTPSIDLRSFYIPATEENVTAIIRLIQFQIPEAIHLTTFYQYGVTGGIFNFLSVLVPAYNADYDADTLQTNLAQCRKIASDLVKDLGNCSEVEKALLLHDRIALLNTYNHDAVADSASEPEAFNMAGVLLNGKAVCQGISVTYQYLLDLVGMENRICISDGLNHAWNIVTVGEAEYHVDITWDDPTLNSSQRDVTGYVRHTNFLRSSAGIYSTGHTATDYDTTPADTTFDDYFWQDITTSFQRAGDELYYIDQQEKALMRFRDQAKILDLSAEVWALSNGATFVSNYSYLASDGFHLLYSGSKAVYRIDPKTLNKETLYTPALPGDHMIFGIKLQDGSLYCELHDEPYPSYVTENITIVSTPYTAVGLADVVLLLRYLIGSLKNADLNFFDQNGDQTITIADAVILLDRLIA